jgi:hypothetical protein
MKCAHRDQWVSTMDTYVLPHIGNQAGRDCRTSEADRNSKEEMARRILQRIDAVFVSAITLELRDKANPCTSVARELGQRRRDKVHHAALPYAEVASFVQRLRQHKGPIAGQLAFKFLILTATRSGEVRGAAWSAINLSAREWTLSAECSDGPVELCVARFCGEEEAHEARCSWPRWRQWRLGWPRSRDRATLAQGWPERRAEAAGVLWAAKACAKPGRPLSAAKCRRNRRFGKVRAKVEHVFRA